MDQIKPIVATFWVTVIASFIALGGAIALTDIELTPEQRTVAEQQRQQEREAREAEESQRALQEQQEKQLEAISGQRGDLLSYKFDSVSDFGTAEATVEESIEATKNWVTANNLYIPDYATFRITLSNRATELKTLIGTGVVIDASTGYGSDNKMTFSNETTSCSINLPTFEKTCEPKTETP